LDKKPLGTTPVLLNDDVYSVFDSDVLKFMGKNVSLLHFCTAIVVGNCTAMANFPWKSQHMGVYVGHERPQLAWHMGHHMGCIWLIWLTNSRKLVVEICRPRKMSWCSQCHHVISLLFEIASTDSHSLVNDSPWRCIWHLIEVCLVCIYVSDWRTQNEGASSVQDGIRGSTTLRRHSRALGDPCYLPVIWSQSSWPSRYHRGPLSTGVHLVSTDVCIQNMKVHHR